MGTCALVFINSKLLCYTHYDSHPFKLGGALSRIKTNWKDILQCCKEYRILVIDAKNWIKDPKFIYDCYDDDWQRSYPELLDSQFVEQFKNGNKKIIDEKFEEVLVDWPNEPYTTYFNMTDDYQYNHYDDRVFIRLRYTNFPWVPIEDLGPNYTDEHILDEIFYDMLGILDPSEHIVKPNPDKINLFELMGLQKPPYSFRYTVNDPSFSGSEEVKSLIDKCRDGAIASGRHFILACKKATELIPDDPNNWWNYGVSLELLGRLDDAIKMYLKAAEFTPTNPTIWRILGSAHSKLGHNLEAKECLKKAISFLKNFDLSDNYIYIAIIEKEITAMEGILTKITNNEEIYDRLYASLIPIYTEFNKWNKVGWAFFKLGKIDDAINSFRNSLNEIFDNEFIEPIKNRLIRFKKYLKEISFTDYSPVSKIIVDHLREKLNSHPNNPALWRLIAENLLDCGNYEEALKACQSCMINLSDIYNKKAQDNEKNNLITLLKNTKFAYLIPQIDNIQTKKRNELFRSFEVPKYIKSLKFSPDSKFIVAEGKDKKINVWNVYTGELYKTFEANSRSSFSFSYDGKYLSVSDKNIQIWDVEKGNIMFILDGHKKGGISTSFTSDGKFLISVSNYDRTIKFWNLFQKKVLWNHIIESKYSLGNFNFEITPNGKNVIYTHENIIITLDINNGQIIKQYNGGWPMTVSPSGLYIAFPYDETTLFIADIKTGKPIKILQGHNFELRSLKFSPGDYLLIGGESSKFNEGCNIYLWKVSTGKLFKTLEGHTDSVRVLDCSQDGIYLASAGLLKINIWKNK